LNGFWPEDWAHTLGAQSRLFLGCIPDVKIDALSAALAQLIASDIFRLFVLNSKI
jgi:hypothetical protein